MNSFKQDFSNARYKRQYKLIDGHLVEVGKVDLQELYNSMLPNSLDSILKAFLEPDTSNYADTTVVESHTDSFEDLMMSVNSYAEENNLTDLSFSELLNRMINNTTEVSNPQTSVEKSNEVKKDEN